MSSSSAGYSGGWVKMKPHLLPGLCTLRRCNRRPQQNHTFPNSAQEKRFRTCYNSPMGKRQTDSASGGERVNLKTLASLLELSQTTISLVLNDSPAARSIPAQTRER